MGRLNGGERLVSEQRTDVWSERISNSDGEQGRKEHESEAHGCPESTLDTQRMVSVFNSPALGMNGSSVRWM